MDLSSKTISEIKRLLAQSSLSELEILLTILESDERSGVKKLVESYRRAMARAEAEESALFELTKYERGLHSQGFDYVAGVDEAGRGALAGPLVAAAAILPKDAKLYGLKDSKLLSPKQREALFDHITNITISWHVVRIEHDDIDENGIQWANIYALEQAALALNPPADCVLSDAFPLRSLEIPHLAITKGDNLSLSIAAASVLAKVTRDRIMRGYHDIYPQYGFDQHKGYGTPQHIKALEKHGVSPIHRKYFSPIAEYRQLQLYPNEC